VKSVFSLARERRFSLESKEGTRTLTDQIIQMQGVHFHYNPESEHPIHALRGIDLDVEAGDYLVIVGHNGSGKSTLAKNINVLLRPTEGDIWVKGMNTRQVENTLAIRSSVGMVFQVPDNQIVATIVEQDVAFGPENLGVPRDELKRRVDWALEVVEMAEHRHRPPHRLSGGQKQRVAIAGAIAMRPDILILDEATALLDPKGREDVLSAVRCLNEEGMTVIAITHFMHEAVEGNRVIVMEAGKIVLQGTPREVFDHVEQLRAMQLDVPQAKELAHLLHERDPAFPTDPLLVEELVDEVERHVGGRGTL
jgi:energy-coupling factor transporter ATPase